MRNLFTLALAGSLMLAGCAGRKAVEEAPVAGVAPPAVEQPAPAVAKTPADSVPVVSEPVAVEPVAERIFFDFDSASLSAASREALKGNARWLQEQEEVRIVIEGHADERGSDTYNLALGEKRARAASEYLLSLGIEAERINIISYGEEKATSGAANEMAWARDRRAEFVKAN